MKTVILVGLVGVLAGGGAGYFVGKGEEGGSESAQSADSSARGSLMSRGGRGGRGDKDGSRRGQKRSGDRVTSSGINSGESYENIVAQPIQTGRLKALIDYYLGLSQDEFAAEAEKLSDLPFDEQMLNGYLLFTSWAEAAPMEALDHAKSMGRTGMFVRPAILKGWAASDPAGAAAYYEENKQQFAMMGMMGRRGGSSAAGSIAAEWAKQDPDGALEWAKSLEGREGSRAAASVLASLAATDPAKAAEMSSGMDVEEIGRANRAIAREWAKKDWGAAEGWIESLPEDQRGRAMGEAIEGLASEDVNLAADKVMGMAEGEGRNRAMESVVESMAREDAAKAARWLEANGNDEVQEEVTRDLVSNWVSQDRDAAKEWALARPEGELRDSAVASFVFNDDSGNPRENMELAASVGDERSRQWGMTMTARRWMAEDREAATAYIQSSEMFTDRMKRRALGRGRGR